MTASDANGLLEAGNGGWDGNGLPSETSEKRHPASAVGRYLSALVSRPFRLDPPGTPPRRLRSTAYLDGLRGFMAFIVYIHHNVLWAHAAGSDTENEILENAYGYHQKYYFAALPFVRNFFTGGHIAVAVFFIISGYVLAAKPLSLILAGDHKRLLESISSSVFRRWFRLYIPIVATTWLYVTSWHIPGYYVPNCEQAGNIWDEWWNWYCEFKNFSFLFKEGPTWVTYNRHLWSIPLEMRGSIVVFCAMLALHRVKHGARHLSLAALIFYFLYIADAYYCALFVMGVLLCDLDLMAAKNHPSYYRFLINLRAYQTPLCCCFFTFGMFLAGCPSHDTSVETLRNNPMWHYLSYLKPQAVFDAKWFFLFWASTMIVVTSSRLAPLKRFFETDFCQYLGRISYALYLVHGPVLSSLGDRVYTMVGFVRPNDQDKMAAYIGKFPLSMAGPLGLEVAFLLPHLIIAPATFLLANFVTRNIDEPAVSLPAKLYARIQADEGSQPRLEDTQRLA